MRVEPKKRWGSQPQKERGKKPSLSEEAYIRQCGEATAAGTLAAQDPMREERHVPRNFNEDQASYWLAAFRRERRRRP